MPVAPLAVLQSEPDLAELLAGRQLDIYAVERFLGRGGMAWVFLARHANLHRACAIKVLCPELQGRKHDSLESFVSEARVAASVVHPHIVAVHNIGSADGYHFIELEYVQGRSLQALAAGHPLDSHRDDAGFAHRQPLSPLQATDYLRQACSALAEAHRQGLVHRDFKPANILVRTDGVAKLADFGLAKKIVAGEGESLAGTPYYMAPELFQGGSASKAADVYAVGVSLFQLLTGSFPFDHHHWLELAKLHADAPVPDVRQANPQVADELAALIEACLAKDPSDRPADGMVLHAQLQSICRGLRDLRSLAEEALAGLDASWEIQQGTIVVSVRLPGGRGQRVLVEETHDSLGRTRLVRIYSVCAPVCDDYLRRALELNMQIPHGSLAIQEIDGEPHFVVLNSYPRDTCDAEEIRHSVLDVAQWADQVEWTLTGEDKR